MAEKRILLVEDIRDWQEQLRSILQREGYQVLTVSTYKEALELLRRTTFPLVIVDLRLNPTDESNREGLKLLKDLAEEFRIPAIVITAYGDEEVEERVFKECKAFDFFGKEDLDPKELRAAVREAFQEIEAREGRRAELRRRFMRGEIINLRDEMDAIGWPLPKRQRRRG